MRFRLTYTAVSEYQVNEDAYMGETDPQKMLAIDIASVKDSPEFLIEDAQEETVIGEVIEE